MSLASRTNRPRPRRRLRPRIGIQALCQDGRGLNGEDNRREFRLLPAIRKTAEDDHDDEDEKDSGMTLNLGSPAFGCFPSLVKNLKMAAANTH